MTSADLDVLELPEPTPHDLPVDDPEPFLDFFGCRDIKGPDVFLGHQLRKFGLCLACHVRAVLVVEEAGEGFGDDRGVESRDLEVLEEHVHEDDRFLGLDTLQDLDQEGLPLGLGVVLRGPGIPVLEKVDPLHLAPERVPGDAPVELPTRHRLVLRPVVDQEPDLGVEGRPEDGLEVVLPVGPEDRNLLVPGGGFNEVFKDFTN